jgi:cell division septation protein DedD
MAPILIDSRDLIKFGFISVLTAMAVFSAGFLSGHEQAASFYLEGSVQEPLSLPEKISTIESDLGQKIPAVIDAGEEIDVDQPQSKAYSSLASNIKTAAIDSALAVENEFGGEALVTDKNINAEIENVQKMSNEAGITVTSEENISKSTAGNDSINAAADLNYQAVVANSFTEDELSKIKYSIQVGMYGRLINAENMMELLQEQQLNAYVSDYTNNKKEVRYNVRFGYFVDKKAALSALREYKRSQNGDGYLVKFSVENITNLARAINTEQPVLDESSEGLMPETKKQEPEHDKTLPVDVDDPANV